MNVTPEQLREIVARIPEYLAESEIAALRAAADQLDEVKAYADSNPLTEWRLAAILADNA